MLRRTVCLVALAVASFVAWRVAAPKPAPAASPSAADGVLSAASPIPPSIPAWSQRVPTVRRGVHPGDAPETGPHPSHNIALWQR